MLIATLLALVLAMSGAQMVLPKAKAAALPQYNKIVVVVFENTNRSEITGNAQAPTFNKYANNGADITDIHAVNGNSFPNYLALFGGATFGVNDNNCPAPFSRTEPSLGGQVLAAGKTFGSYNEAWSKGQFTNLPCPALGGFSAKHNPWFFFKDLEAHKNTFFTGAEFPTTPAGYAALPDVSFYVPDMCNSIHDRVINSSCGISTGDNWLKGHLDGYAEWAKANNSLLITTFDEEAKNGNVQPFPLSFFGANVKQGQVTRNAKMYSLTRTIQDLEGLPCLRESCNTTGFSDAFTDSGPGEPAITNPGPQKTKVNTAVNLPIRVTGGTSPYTCTVRDLPTGLTNGGTGCTITGSPTAAGENKMVKVTAADNAGKPAPEVQFTWEITSEDPGPGPGEPPAEFDLSPNIAEQSGLAMSRKHKDIVYANSDQTPEVHAYDTKTGQRKAVFTLSGVSATDLEGLSVGKDEAGRPAIYIGNIGNNGGGDGNIYRFPEPDTLANASVTPTTYRTQYPGGRVDAESMMIDYDTNQLYIATKVWNAAGKLYKAPNPLSSSQANSLQEVTGRAVPVFATDASYSPDGKAYAIRSTAKSAGIPVGGGKDAVWIYSASGTLLKEVPLQPQNQGESITYFNCKWLLYGSEGEARIRRVELPAEAVPDPNCQGTPTPSPKVTSPGDQKTQKGTAVDLPIQVTGGKAPYTCTLTGLPAGLDNPGQVCRVSGTPTTVRPSGPVTVTAKDADGKSSEPVTFNWEITDQPPGGDCKINNPGDQTFKFNTKVNLKFTATGCTGTLTYTLTGKLPFLLILTGDTLSGTVYQTGTYPVTVTVKDGAGKTSSAAFKIVVNWF